LFSTKRDSGTSTSRGGSSSSSSSSSSKKKKRTSTNTTTRFQKPNKPSKNWHKHKKTDYSLAHRNEEDDERINKYPPPSDPTAMETWRIYGISVHPDELAQDDDNDNSTVGTTSAAAIPSALQKAIETKLRWKISNSNSSSSSIQIVRRSLDARQKLRHPVYNYVIEVSLPASERFALKWRPQSGRMEQLEDDNDKKKKMETINPKNDSSDPPTEKKTVVIVGMGPAGLFCALQLALKSNGAIRPILLDRGQPVEKRGRDIGALMHRRSLDSESNFAFGEGGAGTWSDGKLTTRIGRNNETVRGVLELLVEFGAPSNIL
jgi:hypothetical protein